MLKFTSAEAVWRALLHRFHLRPELAIMHQRLVQEFFEPVECFLDEVAAQFRRYDERLTQMAHRVAALESELSQSRESEDMTRRMMLVAQRAGLDAIRVVEAVPSGEEAR